MSVDRLADRRQGRAVAEGESGFFAFLLGLGVGVGVALLLTPQSGEETRELIGKKAREGMAYAVEAAEDLQLQLEAGWFNAGKVAQSMKDRVEEAIAGAKEKVQQAVRAGEQAYREDLSARETEPGKSPAATDAF